MNSNRDREKIKERLFSAQEIGEIVKEVLGYGADFRFQARGWSMAPFIRDGDILTISRLKNSRIKIGQIVAVVDPERKRMMVHRIVRRKGRHYVVKGDNLLSSDGSFSSYEILGVVTKIERGNRVIFPKWTLGQYLIACFSRNRVGMKIISEGRRLARLGRIIKKMRTTGSEEK